MEDKKDVRYYLFVDWNSICSLPKKKKKTVFVQQAFTINKSMVKIYLSSIFIPNQ